MATAKKPATKKASVKKTPAKAPAKKVVAAKATPAKTTAKKVPSTKKTKVSKATQSGYKSFKVSAPAESFTTFKITRQTVYWVILIAFIIFVQLWILKLQIELASLLELQQSELINNI